MSGHSKWSTIKHKKGAADAKRGKLFTKLSKAIIVAAKEGGPDPAANLSLQNAVEKAKSYSMPKDTIERAIARGAGTDADAAAYETIVYEGYGPDGVAVLVEALTDNRNRTASDVRHTFAKHGGNLGTTGAVAWLFERRGVGCVRKLLRTGECSGVGRILERAMRVIRVTDVDDQCCEAKQHDHHQHHENDDLTALVLRSVGLPSCQLVRNHCPEPPQSRRVRTTPLVFQLP